MSQRKYILPSFIYSCIYFLAMFIFGLFIIPSLPKETLDGSVILKTIYMFALPHLIFLAFPLYSHFKLLDSNSTSRALSCSLLYLIPLFTALPTSLLLLFPIIVIFKFSYQ